MTTYLMTDERFNALSNYARHNVLRMFRDPNLYGCYYIHDSVLVEFPAAAAEEVRQVCSDRVAPAAPVAPVQPLSEAYDQALGLVHRALTAAQGSTERRKLHENAIAALTMLTAETPSITYYIRNCRETLQREYGMNV
jgi:hypothetical protein